MLNFLIHFHIYRNAPLYFIILHIDHQFTNYYYYHHNKLYFVKAINFNTLAVAIIETCYFIISITKAIHKVIK